jgi:perosamine synthetase
MNIFNSLGSNYDFKFSLKALLANGSSERLKKYLAEKYQGEVVFLYKGREAIQLALNLTNLPKDCFVAVNGFTCFVVYQAVKNAFLKVELIDITEQDLNFKAKDLKEIVNKNPEIKAVIIQNTLGYPCEIEDITKLCREKNIILIEDLAHSVGTRFGNKEAGSFGDFVALSFSQDKMIDAISGGALIIRNKKYQNQSFEKLNRVSLKQQIIDRFYPSFTYKIRSNYPIGLGKISHKIFKSLGLLSQPMGNLGNSLHGLSGWYTKLAYYDFQELENNLGHRREIAKIYSTNLDERILLKSVTDNIESSTNLRFPIFLEDREGLVKNLKQSGIYISDIWYDAPIAPKKFMKLTDYKNQCPNSEKISRTILNLPTHKNVSEKDALKICQKINQWLKS